jgi:hypothetical protein
MKTPIEHFIHRENIKFFKERLAAPTDEAQRKTLLTLLAEEEAKGEQFVVKAKSPIRQRALSARRDRRVL